MPWMGLDRGVYMGLRFEGALGVEVEDGVEVEVGRS
jgi:hypothetical protein